MGTAAGRGGTGTQSARPSSEESMVRSGKGCTTSVCTLSNKSQGNRRVGKHTTIGVVSSRAAVRHALWVAHMQSPMSALEEALKRTGEGGKGRVFRRRRERNWNILRGNLFFPVGVSMLLAVCCVCCSVCGSSHQG